MVTYPEWLPLPPSASRLSLYRLSYSPWDHDRFCNVLAGIRPDENKIRRIEPGINICRTDVVISDEELSFLKLAVPNLKDSWLQMWDENVHP